MNSMRDGLRAALYAGSDPRGALSIGDTIMATEGEGRFATALVALLDVKGRTLTVASAGHPGPLVWIAAERKVVDTFRDRSLPLGMQKLFGATQGEASTLALSENDFALFFTDGLIEWQHDPSEGMRRVEEALRDVGVRHALQPALALRHRLLTGPTPDDVAILTLRAD